MLRAIGDKLGVEGAAEKKVMEQLSEHTAIEKRSFIALRSLPSDRSGMAR